MTTEKKSPTRWMWPLLLLGLVLGGAAYGYHLWQENKAMDDMVAPGLRLINYTDDDLHTWVRNAKFPEPGQGAYEESGPGGGWGSISCCVPIPAKWRPGIKMNVHYRFGKWPEGKEEMKVVELPEYPDGEAGDLYLVFHSETEFELVSSGYTPEHAKWPGKRVEPIIFGE